MSEFKREERYIVLKISKMLPINAKDIKDYVNSVGCGSALTECVVVESDWPNYEQTWRDVEAVSRGEFQDRQQLQSQLAEAERARDGLSATFEREFKALCSMYIKLSNKVVSGDFSNETPEGNIYDVEYWVENRWKDITDPVFTTHQEALAALKRRVGAEAVTKAVNELERPDVPLAPSMILNHDLLDFAKRIRSGEVEL